MLLWHRPKLACRSCDDCEKYEYDEDGDQVKEWDGRVNLPVLRLPHNPPVCWACDKVPEKVRQQKERDVSREDAMNLTDRGWAIWTHYKQCLAVGEWPRDRHGNVDPIVKRHAGLIRELRGDFERREVTNRLDQLATLMTLGRRA